MQPTNDELMLRIASFAFSPIQENTYILYNQSGLACLIDPGCYSRHEETALKEFIADHALRVTMLLQTHCHLDHVFGLKWASEHFNLLPHIHTNELQVLQVAGASGEMWNLPFDAYTGPVEWLVEEQELMLGSDKLKVLYVPGHSPGHVCFYCEAQHFVIGGDVLFQRSIGRTDLPGGNHSLLVDGIRKKLLTLPDSTMIYPGHGPATTVGEEKQHNPFL